MKKTIKGFVCKTDITNFDFLTRHGEGIEFFANKEIIQDLLGKRVKIVPCEIILKQ